MYTPCSEQWALWRETWNRKSRELCSVYTPCCCWKSSCAGRSDTFTKENIIPAAAVLAVAEAQQAGALKRLRYHHITDRTTIPLRQSAPGHGYMNNEQCIHRWIVYSSSSSGSSSRLHGLTAQTSFRGVDCCLYDCYDTTAADQGEA